MQRAPAGTVTFLFTDIEGSTRLWEEQPAAMGDDATRALVRVLDAEMIVTMMIDGSEGWARAGVERVAAARADGDPYELARALASCAVALTSNGTDARELAEEALDVARRLGNPSARCGAAMSFAQAIAARDAAAALESLTEGEEAAMEGGNDVLADVVHGVRAYVVYSMGDLTHALPALLDTCDAQVEKGYLSYVLGYLRLVAGALAAAHRDEPAAVLIGFWDEYGSMFAAGPDWDLVDHEALAELPRRLGAERYERLLSEGARLPDVRTALAYARPAVMALVE